MKFQLVQFLLLGSAAAHGYVKRIIVDGNAYTGYLPGIDNRSGAKRIVWAFPKHNTAGAGPVKDVTSPDITCRHDPQFPQLKATARAGSTVRFDWTDYYIDHKGPVMTYMGRLPDLKMKVQDVEFFKIDEDGYDPIEKIWGTDNLIKANNSRTVTIPSDIKPGLYVMRHEILSLHFVDRSYGGIVEPGYQFYPVCLNVEVTGSGTATPPGVKFPGGYKKTDPGVTVNSYYGVDKYITPGPPVYAGKHDPPQGPPPKATPQPPVSARFAKMENDVLKGSASMAPLLNNVLSQLGMVGATKGGAPPRKDSGPTANDMGIFLQNIMSKGKENQGTSDDAGHNHYRLFKA